MIVWTEEEKEALLKLRGDGLTWAEVKANFPGKTLYACMKFYHKCVQDEYTDEIKNKVASLYESHKAKMWATIAEIMNVPWTEAEKNHWVLGKREMEKRAGDPDFRESWYKDYVASESKTNDDSNLGPPPVDNAEDEVSAHEEQGRIQSRVAWTGKEESSLFDLKAAGENWNYISNLLPGRGVRSCMSYYRHIRDRAGGWSPELQTDLSRLYQM
ncbi:hypothetical protein E4U25_003256 [Claviceps purpurea]|nr:hypothetical protein E4U25_003256 [Claviceps purpurea]